MKLCLAALACLALVACNGGSGGGASSGASWGFYNPVPVSIGANGLPTFTFPSTATIPDTGNLCPNQQGGAGPGLCFSSANYLMGIPPNSISGTLSASWSITGDAGAVFDYRTNPNNTCNYPSSASLYIQQLGDPWNQKGYRYYSVGARTPLALGSGSLSASLADPSLWADMIDGSLASLAPSAFAQTKSHMGSWGVIFGGGCFAGHGVIVDPPYTASFTLTSFGIN